MAETLAAVEDYKNCSRCGKQREDAGSGFITICRNKGRASGQEVISVYLCAGCLDKCQDKINAFLRQGLPTPEEKILMTQWEDDLLEEGLGGVPRAI